MGLNISMDLNSALKAYQEDKRYNKEAYEELLSKYEESIKHINILEETIAELRKKTIPTANEIESIKAVLGLFGIEKLDADGICKFAQIQSMISGAKE